MTGTRTVHEEIIEVGFNTERAKQQLSELQKLADALMRTVSGQGLVVGDPTVTTAMTGAGVGVSQTQSSTAVVAQQATQTPRLRGPDGRFVSPSAVSASGAGGVVAASGTVSSGQAISDAMEAPRAYVPPVVQSGTIITQGGGTPPAPAPPAPTIPPAPSSSNGWSMPGVLATAPAQMLGGGTQGVLQGSLGVLAAAAGGGALGAFISSLGSLSGLDAAMAVNRERGGIERTFALSQLSGLGLDPRIDPASLTNALTGGMASGLGLRQPGDGLNNYLARAAQLGISPQEAASMAGAYTSSAGGATARTDFLAASLAGIDASTMGAIDRTRLLGGAVGGGGDALRLAGAGQGGFGVIGGLNQWLQSLTGQVDRLIQRGLRVDLGEVAGLLESMAGDPVLRRLGDRAPGVLGALAAPAADARSMLLQPFQSLGQSATLMEAIAGGGGPRDWIKRLETMGPSGTIKAVRDNFGEFAAEGFAATAPGLFMEEAEALAGGLKPGSKFGLRKIPAHTYARNRIVAEREAERLRSDPTSVENMGRLEAGDRFAEALAAQNAEFLAGLSKWSDMWFEGMKEVLRPAFGNGHQKAPMVTVPTP